MESQGVAPAGLCGGLQVIVVDWEASGLFCITRLGLVCTTFVPNRSHCRTCWGIDALGALVQTWLQAAASILTASSRPAASDGWPMLPHRHDCWSRTWRRHNPSVARSQPDLQLKGIPWLRPHLLPQMLMGSKLSPSTYASPLSIAAGTGC